MKKAKIIAIMMLCLSTLLSVFPANGMTRIQAQESTESLVNINVNVYLQLQGSTPIEQGQISYDIIEPNPNGGDGTVIWSYRSENPPAEILQLAPGDYRFRLFDGGNFERNGERLMPYRFEQTIANLTAEDLAANQTKRSLDPGQLNEWSDGQIVYDVPFSIGLGESIYNPTTDNYEVDLDFTLADAMSSHQTGNSEEDNSNQLPDEVAPNSTMGSMLNVLATDENGSPLPQVSVYINEEAYVTDEQGILEVTDLTAGDYLYISLKAPEGFVGGGNQEIIVEENKIYEVDVMFTAAEIQASSLTVNVVGSSQEPVPNVVVEVDGEQKVTDSYGEAYFEAITPGEKALNIIEVPENYLLTEQSHTVIADGVNPVNKVIQLNNEVQTGNIHFIVKDEQANPISNTEIQIGEQSLDTNEAGIALFENLPIGGYSYSVNSVPEGLDIPAEGTINVDAGETYQEEITLSSIQEYGDIMITVIDEDNNSIPGAQIELNGQIYPANGEGNVIIEDLPANEIATYAISSVPADYDIVGEAEERTIEIIANEMVQANLQVSQPRQEGSVVFEITNENAEPISNVSITLMEQSLRTDENGQVAFDNLPAGQYAYYISELPEGYVGNLQGEVTILADERIEKSEVLSKEQKYGDIRFIVEDQAGERVYETSINLNGGDYRANEAGEIIITGLIADETYSYTLISNPENYSGQVNGTVDIVADDIVNETITIERELTPGQFSVNVLDQNDQPVVGAEIVLNSELSETTNESGQAIFAEIDEGTYNYSLNEVPDNYVFNDSSQSIYIAEGANEERTLRVQREIDNGSVVLDVVDQNGDAVSNVEISFNDDLMTTNQTGQVSINTVQPGTYYYETNNLPEGYSGEVSGEITVIEGEQANATLEVQRNIELGVATYTVLDQNDTPVEGVTIQIGGLTGTTDTNGQAKFSDMELGNYNVSITNLPNAYTSDFPGTALAVEEGDIIEETLVIEKLPEEGSLQIQVLDTESRPVPGAVVAVDGERVKTNSDGQANFASLELGDYRYTIISVPNDYSIASNTGQATVDASNNSSVTVEVNLVEATSSEESSSETDSEESSLSESVETSVTVDETEGIETRPTAEIEAEAEEATHKFVDADTGIEVWVNPVDANNIVRVDVTKLRDVAALGGMNYDSYDIKLLDRNNQPVQLTRIAEVKLPTRPVTSQLRVVRVGANDLSNLTFSLHNQRVTFRTQELGAFGIVYGTAIGSGEDEAETSSVNVEQESSVEKTSDNLPGTGERSVFIVLGLAVILLIGGLFIIFYRKRESK